MSLRSIPLIIVVLILYNVIVALLGPEILSKLLLPEIKLPSGGILKFTWGDFIVVFVACLVEFLMTPLAANSVFFMIMVAALIDVVAGYTIGIRVARRDLTLGHGG